MLEKYIKELVEKKANISTRGVYTHFHKLGLEFGYTDIGIFLRNSYNGGKMPGYDMKQYEIGKSDRLEQIYYYKRGWLETIKMFFGQ
jgi:hypothetical protein